MAQITTSKTVVTLSLPNYSVAHPLTRRYNLPTMVTQTLEDRLAAVEHELTQIKQQLAAEKSPTVTSGWENMFGSFADSEGFEEATRLGREWRVAQNALSDEAGE